MRHSICIITVLNLLTLPILLAQSSKVPLAATPPMGWNSWDSYGLTITEAQKQTEAGR